MIGYFQGCNSKLVDCLGRPIKSISSKNNQHFILIGMLLCLFGIKYLINWIYIYKCLGGVSFGKIPTVVEKHQGILYIVSIYGIVYAFGLPGIYSIIYNN